MTALRSGRSDPSSHVPAWSLLVDFSSWVFVSLLLDQETTLLSPGLADPRLAENSGSPGTGRVCARFDYFPAHTGLSIAQLKPRGGLLLLRGGCWFCFCQSEGACSVCPQPSPGKLGRAGLGAEAAGGAHPHSLRTAACSLTSFPSADIRDRGGENAPFCFLYLESGRFKGYIPLSLPKCPNECFTPGIMKPFEIQTKRTPPQV